MQTSPVPEVFRVVRSVHGAEWIDPEPFSLGPCMIAGKQSHAKVMEGYFIPETIGPWFFDGQGTIAVAEVSALTQEDAFAKADVFLRRLENVFRHFAVSLDAPFDVGILDVKELRQSFRLAASKTKASFNLHNEGPLHGLELKRTDTDNWFGLPWLAKAIAANKPTELQQRVLGALEWRGRAITTRYSGTRMAQLMFALESLVQGQQSAISPSIMAQTSETASLLLAAEVNGRIATEKELKELYRKRSALAHGREVDVQEEDVYALDSIVVDLITAFTTDPTLSKLTAFAEVEDLLRRMKYSGPSLNSLPTI